MLLVLLKHLIEEGNIQIKDFMYLIWVIILYMDEGFHLTSAATLIKFTNAYNII